MTLRFHFKDDNSQYCKLRKPSYWQPPQPKNKNLLQFFQAITNDISNSNLFDIPFDKQNVSKEEISALKRLQTNRNIVIKPADKGGSIVIMNKSDYIDKVRYQLNDTNYYLPLAINPTKNIGSEISGYIDHLQFRGYITQKTADFLQPPKQPRTPIFYGLPKIHKDNIPLRPIVSANEAPTENISAYIDYICQPLMKALPSYIRDTKDFLQKTLSITSLPPGSFLVTADVVSLYTNIPHEEGIQALMTSMCENKHLLPEDAPPPHCAKQLLEFILTENCFEFVNSINKSMAQLWERNVLLPTLVYTWAT